MLDVNNVTLVGKCTHCNIRPTKNPSFHSFWAVINGVAVSASLHKDQVFSEEDVKGKNICVQGFLSDYNGKYQLSFSGKNIVQIPAIIDPVAEVTVSGKVTAVNGNRVEIASTYMSRSKDKKVEFKERMVLLDLTEWLEAHPNIDISKIKPNSSNCLVRGVVENKDNQIVVNVKWLNPAKFMNLVK